MNKTYQNENTQNKREDANNDDKRNKDSNINKVENSKSPKQKEIIVFDLRDTLYNHHERYIRQTQTIMSKYLLINNEETTGDSKFNLITDKRKAQSVVERASSAGGKDILQGLQSIGYAINKKNYFHFQKKHWYDKVDIDQKLQDILQKSSFIFVVWSNLLQDIALQTLSEIGIEEYIDYVYRPASSNFH